MRIAIFSDIHSSLEALQPTVEAMKALEPDRYICLGDVVGYGASPDACCDIVKPFAEITILGNHDAAVSGRMDYAYYYDAARTALSHHARLLSEENMAWLRELPYTVVEEELGVCFSHGSPIQPQNFDYILSEEQAALLQDHYDELQHVTFIGHSHLVKSFLVRPPGSEAGPSLEVTAERLELKPDYKYIVTVGSVGQPRDHDARACFVLWDTDERTVTYHRVNYDVAAAAAKVFEDKRLSADFGKRLYLGV